jgi:hypothetical protein
MYGYPGISLYDNQGHLLPLNYYWGGDQMVTASPPERVGLAVGGTAYVMLNKNACEYGPEDVAATLQLVPPDDTSALGLAVATPIAACEPGEASTLAISPVEPSVQATYSG